MCCTSINIHIQPNCPGAWLLLREQMLSLVRALAPCRTWSARTAVKSSLTSSLRGLSGAADSGAPEQRDSLHFDLLIVGAGPAGLSAAIRFKQASRHGWAALTGATKRAPRLTVFAALQLCRENGKDMSVCVIEKGAEVGESWHRM